tara:strand:+ start:431 stop:1432 length:1002 start_codon:yes stop_codon:yes gene_type:complete
MIENLIKPEYKVFIAGATGMVGRAIKKNLAENNYGLKEYGGCLLTPNRKKLNLINHDEVSNWFEENKPDLVILAAAKVGGIFANSEYPADFILENLKIQNNVIESAFKFKAKRFLFLGSSCIYPKYAQQPIEEESLLSGELEKTNEWYAIAKIAGLKLCQSLRIQYGFDAIALMPTNLYGPADNYDYQNSHVMAALIRKFVEAKINNFRYVSCWGTGSPLREFLHVNDLANSVRFVLENWDPCKQKFLTKDNKDLFYLNVGTGKDITIKELALKIASKVGFKGEIKWDNTKPDGTPKKQLDISRITKLGWRPTISLDEGIETTIKSFKEEYKL